MNDNELFALIGGWAKTHQPEAYAQTLKVATVPTKFRRYLVRLVEVRAEQEPSFVREVPLSVLEESKVAVSLRSRKDGRLLRVGGRLVAGREWSFAELAATPEEFALLTAAREHLDMVCYDGD